MSEAAETALAPTTDRQENYLQSVSHVRMGIAPQNLEEGFRLATLLAKSTLVPKDFQGNAGNVMIAIQMGMEVGLAPMQALQSIAVINGRPSLWGDGMLAVVMGSQVFEWIDEPPVQNNQAVCTVKRRGWGTPVSRSFSMDDAKKAGLWGKAGPWTNYPTRMLQMRARAFALRDVFADVLRGLGCAEELRDVESASASEQIARPMIQEVRRLAEHTPAFAVDTATGEITEPETKSPKAETKPAVHETTAPAPEKSTTATYHPATAYHPTKVWQPNAAKPYHILQTAEGVMFHTWSTTVIEGAKAALASQLPVHLVAEAVNFVSAPWRVTKLELADISEPGAEG